MAKKPTMHSFSPQCLMAASVLAKHNRDVSQQDIAAAIGCDQQTISRILRGETRSGGFKWPLIRFLAPELWQLAHEKNTLNVINELRELGLQPKDDNTIKRAELGGTPPEYTFDLFEPRLGRGDDKIMVFPSRPSAKTLPPNFPHSSKAYAFRMIGDMMRPTYRNGEEVYVDPESPPQMGDDCLFLDANRTRSRVGHLISMSPSTWRVTTRPETRMEEGHDLSVSDWPFCEKIVGVRRL